MISRRRLLITTGDVDGIGWEVTTKALEKIGPVKGVEFVVFRSPSASKRDLKRLSKKFKIRSYTTWPDALSHQSSSSRELIEVVSQLPPSKWVETAAVACLHNQSLGIVTGPLSKPEIIRAGMKDLGHTEILKRICQKDQAWMSFLGKHFNVVLMTGHLPISQVQESLQPQKIEACLRATWDFFLHLKKPKSKMKPLGILGLNPHAGDQGLIGDFDLKILTPIVEKLRNEGLLLAGPLVPDVAFHKDSWNKYSAFVACYHDQGLIPFKMVHGFQSGVHLTLGLPLLRTSVDHGTAKDLFGKNKADPRSMIDAIRTAIELSATSR